MRKLYHQIVEGLQMNMILDRLVVAKKQLDAAFKLELTPYHPFPYLVGCVVAFVENGRPKQVDFVMHFLWWQIFWIFALSKQCGSFTTKIVEGLQMNMILDCLVVAKKKLDAAFKLELTLYHPFPYLVGCVVAFVEMWRMVGQNKLTLWCIPCDDKSSEYLPWARNAEALPPRSLRVCRWTWFWIAWLPWRNGLMLRRSLNWHHIIHFHT